MRGRAALDWGRTWGSSDLLRWVCASRHVSDAASSNEARLGPSLDPRGFPSQEPEVWACLGNSDFRKIENFSKFSKIGEISSPPEAGLLKPGASRAWEPSQAHSPEARPLRRAEDQVTNLFQSPL